jgi:hypothetical protein
MIKAQILVGLVLSGALYADGSRTSEPHVFFREQMGLSDAQIAMIDRGKAVAKVLPSRTPAEIIIFGAVFVEASPEDYARLAFDMDRLRRSASYIGAARFSDPPILADLDGFTLEPEDIRSLRSCRPGNCGVQLPAEAMREIQTRLNWSEHDVAEQVNHRIREMALGVLLRYQKEGNGVLGSYGDSDHPFDVSAQLQSLLARAQALPVYLPDLNSYLLDYPRAALPGVESLFFWEKVKFGLKPTLRLNHAIAYRSVGPRGMARVVLVKQLYASHYFQLALDLTACVPRNGQARESGFYLISLKGSTQQGLTGLKGSLLRMILVNRTRSAQEKLLVSIKRSLEEKR